MLPCQWRLRRWLLFLLLRDLQRRGHSKRTVTDDLWLTATFGVGSLVWNALKPGKIFADTLPIDNPAGIEWLAAHLGWLDQVIFIGFAAGIVLSVASAVARFRRSRGIERDRMKWLAFAALGALAFAPALAFAQAAFRKRCSAEMRHQP